MVIFLLGRFRCAFALASTFHNHVKLLHTSHKCKRRCEHQHLLPRTPFIKQQKPDVTRISTYRWLCHLLQKNIKYCEKNFPKTVEAKFMRHPNLNLNPIRFWITFCLNGSFTTTTLKPKTFLFFYSSD